MEEVAPQGDERTLPLMMGTVSGPLCCARLHPGWCGKEATLPAPKPPKPEPIIAGFLSANLPRADFDLTWPGDDGIRPSKIVRCEEHKDVINDNSLCTKCDLPTNSCDSLGNWKSFSQDNQMHRNCNHPGPWLFEVNKEPCTVAECKGTNYHAETGMCTWHFVRSPQGRVAEEEE